MRQTRRQRPAQRSGVRRSGSIDVFIAVTLAGVVYALIAYPLILSSCSPLDSMCLYESRPENRVVWPTLAVISALIVAANWRRLAVAPHIVALFAFLAFAGASVLWAFRPELSAIRYAQQVMIITAVVLPPLSMAERGDLLRGLFLCFALACFINAFFVLGPPPKFAGSATPGYAGYFSGKNYLGIFAAIALLLSAHELLYPGWRRWSGVIVAILAVVLLQMSNSKTAAGLAILAPAFALFCVILKRKLRISILAVPLAIVVSYLVVSNLTRLNVYKLSYWIYGDSTFTGRRWIWDFATVEIWKKPLHGWGYQSFWLVGPDAPSIVDAPGWIKTMPNAHNGYFDTTLEMGFIGLALLLIFVGMTLHYSGRIVERDPVRGWGILSLAFFVIIVNAFESMWMRAFEFVWLVFLVLAVDVGRQLRLLRASAMAADAADDVRRSEPRDRMKPARGLSPMGAMPRRRRVVERPATRQ